MNAIYCTMVFVDTLVLGARAETARTTATLGGRRYRTHRRIPTSGIGLLTRNPLLRVREGAQPEMPATHNAVRPVVIG
jgi:hypothetical protein